MNISTLLMKLEYYISRSFCWTEYIVGGIIALVLSACMFHGLIHLFGPVDRYGSSDPEIYDWPTEQAFIEFLHDAGTYGSAYIKEEVAKYRYSHSWRAKYDSVLKDVWIILSFVIVTVAIVQIFKYYRRLKFREKFDSWLYNFLRKINTNKE